MFDEYTIEEYRDGDKRVRVVLDTDPTGCHPREWTQLGTMVMGHRRYDLPREGDLASEVDGALQNHSFPVVARWLRAFHGATVVLPIWGYDHGSLAISTSHRGQFSDRWDSGFLGIIYDTPEGRENTGAPADDIERQLAAEVDEYNQFLQGECYGYVVEELVHYQEVDGERTHEEWEHVDSCWGFLGEADYAMAEGRAAAGMTDEKEGAPT